jgi:hypothetical protein
VPRNTEVGQGNAAPQKTLPEEPVAHRQSSVAVRQGAALKRKIGRPA